MRNTIFTALLQSPNRMRMREGRNLGNIRTPALAIILLLLGQAWVLGAGTEIRSLDWMCERSEAIIHGYVAAKHIYESEGLIWTRYEIKPLDVLKRDGKAREGKLAITQIGGTLNGKTLHVPGIPHFGVGDEVLLFTRDYGGGHQSGVNGSQGCLKVQTVASKSSGGGGPVRIVPSASRLYPELKSAGLEPVVSEIRRIVREQAKPERSGTTGAQ